MTQKCHLQMTLVRWSFECLINISNSTHANWIPDLSSKQALSAISHSVRGTPSLGVAQPFLTPLVHIPHPVCQERLLATRKTFPQSDYCLPHPLLSPWWWAPASLMRWGTPPELSLPPTGHSPQTTRQRLLNLKSYNATLVPQIPTGLLAPQNESQPGQPVSTPADIFPS